MYRCFYWLVLEPAARGRCASRVVRAAACVRRRAGHARAARAMCAPRDPSCACTHSARASRPDRARRRLRQGRRGRRARCTRSASASSRSARSPREPQPGNPKPRLFRLPRDRALDQPHGLQQRRRRRRRARALAHAARRHRRRQHRQDQARRRGRGARRLRASSATLAPLADYLVVNVSSPNTPGLRDLQSVDKLAPAARRRARRERLAAERRGPLLVKIAPDLADAEHELLRGWQGYGWPGEALRFNMLRTHYRQPLDWTLVGLDEAHKNFLGMVRRSQG